MSEKLIKVEILDSLMAKLLKYKRLWETLKETMKNRGFYWVKEEMETMEQV